MLNKKPYEICEMVPTVFDLFVRYLFKSLNILKLFGWCIPTSVPESMHSYTYERSSYKLRHFDIIFLHVLNFTNLDYGKCLKWNTRPTKLTYCRIKYIIIYRQNILYYRCRCREYIFSIDIFSTSPGTAIFIRSEAPLYETLSVRLSTTIYFFLLRSYHRYQTIDNIFCIRS